MDNIITNVDGVKVKVRVYDFGGEVADRYTIVYVNKNIKDGYGVVYYPVFSCSEDPFHPLGVGMYAGDYYPQGEVNYRWRTRCPELVDKIVKHRTKVFTGQLIQLAKVYGEKKVIKYQKEEEEVCQNTIETL